MNYHTLVENIKTFTNATLNHSTIDFKKLIDNQISIYGDQMSTYGRRYQIKLALKEIDKCIIGYNEKGERIYDFNKTTNHLITDDIKKQLYGNSE